MAASRRQVPAVIAVVLAALFALRFFGAFENWNLRLEGFVGLMALLPIFMLVGLVWFGRELLSSLRRIEAAIDKEVGVAPEFNHGS